MDFLISFDDLKAGNKALGKLAQAFRRAGAPVATTDTDPRTRRTSGVNYRQVQIGFTDSQTVTLGVKTSGDIFEVKVNGSVLPIKNQGDQRKAVGEIVRALEAGRAKFQAKMARQKVALPQGIATAAPRMEQKLAAASAELDNRIAAAEARVAELRAELGEPVIDSVHTVAGEKFDGGEIDNLYAFAKRGKLEDGDIPAKDSRDNLVERGFVARGDGFNWLTDKGKEIAAALDAVFDASDRYNPKTDRWVSTENGTKLLIRDGAVIGGAGGKLNAAPAKKPFPKDAVAQVKAAKSMLREKAHTVASFAKEAGIDEKKAKTLLNAMVMTGAAHDPTNNGRIEWNDDMKFHIASQYRYDSVQGLDEDEAAAAALDAVSGTSWYGYKIMDRARAMEASATVLPSGNQIAGHVNVILDDGTDSPMNVGGIVVGTKFMSGKVLYDVAVPLSPEPKVGRQMLAVLKDIESDFVTAASEVMDSADNIAALKRYGKAVLDAVDVPTNTFDQPEVAEAQAIAARILAGDTFDDAQFSHALATLEIALNTVETNHPINLAEGNIEQAELEERAAKDFREAMRLLESKQTAAA